MAITSNQMAAYKAISKKYTLPPIEACTFGSVLGCVVTVEWPGYGAMYSTVTGKVVKPYKM